MTPIQTAVQTTQNGEEARDSETEVDEDPSYSSSTGGPPDQHGRRGVNNYSGGAVGLNINEAPHVNKDSTLFYVFMLYYPSAGGRDEQVLPPVPRQTSRLLCGLTSPIPRCFLFLGIIIQMGHDIRDRLKDYWSTAEQFTTPLYTNMHCPSAEGSFRDEHGNAIKPAIVVNYNTYMGYVDKGDRMANSCSISRRTWKWTNKLFFHRLDLTILNSFLLLSSCSAKLSHRDFLLCHRRYLD
ncbi:hypothetical protein B7P43_G11642 [Cryptotermes secundus]|uniref:PiggyBac transposable element-derived protein domain-containing protein n=1 Tax=Cryptotermes secundus TaxID=105785 RepID=A0A2J7PIW5_9NEOP|nr:hypothetical protein B7P43_G11642 [Cryptotermes secundus]